MKLTYQAESLEVVGYCDADFAGDQDDRKSTTGYVFTLGGGATSWASKKQSSVAHYTMEDEFIACSTAATEAVWVKRFLEDLRLDQISASKIQLMCDNQAAIAAIKNGEVGPRGKHIELQYHYILDMMRKGELFVDYISTIEMIADSLTKPISFEDFRKHVYAMGLRYD